MRKPLKRLKPNHLKFCELCAQFVPPARAYARVFGREGEGHVDCSATQLFREPLIWAEIKRIMGPDPTGDPTYVAHRRKLILAERERMNRERRRRR